MLAYLSDPRERERKMKEEEKGRKTRVLKKEVATYGSKTPKICKKFPSSVCGFELNKSWRKDDMFWTLFYVEELRLRNSHLA